MPSLMVCDTLKDARPYFGNVITQRIGALGQQAALVVTE
jgi:hypothetical protein